MRGGLAALAAIGFALAPGAASADVTVGHTGWAWGNPTPQGNALEAVAFSGQVGVAVGEFGTILRSADGGVTWAPVDSGTRELLTDVAMPDSSTVLAGGGCALRRSDDAGRSFQRVAISTDEAPCRDPISALAFPTPQLGYVFLNSGRVLRTDNAGRTFSRRASVPLTQAHTGGSGTPAITVVSFGDVNTGIAGLSTFDPNFFRTSDAAASWSRVQAAPPPPITLLWEAKGLQFVGPQTAYATGDNPPGARMIKTVDGGQTWTLLPLAGTDNEPKSLHCADALRCVMLSIESYQSSGPDGTLIVTPDGGQTSFAVRPVKAEARTAYVTDTGAILMLGVGGLTVRSPDFGKTFTRIGSAATGPFDHLRRGPGDSVYAFGPRGALGHSNDGGRSFADLDAPLGAQPLDLSFAGATGYALVAGARLLSTADGGETWSVLAGRPDGARAIQAVSPRTVLAATPRGVLRSTDGGESFARTRGAHKPVDGFDRTGGALIAYGAGALMSSRDGGASWRSRPLPSRYDLESVDFVDARHGWATDENWRLWLTRDGARSWIPALSTGGDDVVSVSFADARHGFATTADTRAGDVLRTSDGGRTWRPQAIESEDLDEVLPLGPSSAVALAGETNRIYTTRSGGESGVPSRLAIHATVRGSRVIVRGRLRPGERGRRVSVAARGGRYWAVKHVQVAAGGRFKTTWRLRRDTVFVAQWLGAAGVRGAGTAPLRVRLARHKRR
jgi:photosystem II stability/assembly factor-like uncharacterized protein